MITRKKIRAKILVVDDDQKLLTLLVETLTAVGYSVISASGGVEALQRLNEQTFDLLITDIKMPDIDGIQLARRVRRHYASLPILFITGDADEDILATASPEGLLAKPFRISHIERLIENVLKKGAGGAQHRLRNVLVMADDEKLREELSRAMDNSSYVPFSVSNGDRALKELESGDFHAIIAGLRENDKKLGDLLQAFRDSYPDVPVILMGESDSPVRREKSKERADGFIQKPITMDQVLDLLDRVAGPTPTNN